MPARPLDRQTKGHPPLHVQIASDLRRRIENGEFRDGTGHRLPPQHQFTAEYRAAKDTITRAFSLLGTQGVIAGGRGREPAVQDPRYWKLPDTQRIDKLEARVGKIEDETAREFDELRSRVAALERMVRSRPDSPPGSAAGRF